MTPAVAPNARRRGDVHATPDRCKIHHRPRGPRATDYTKAQLARGTDEEGRFIGRRAIADAWNFFWQSRDPA